MAYSERMRFAFLIYLFASVTSLHAEKPFDFASTPGKLPKQVRPTEYAIWVKPDLKKLAFAGRETVKLKIAEPTRELILNALDLTITDARRLFTCWDEPVFRARFQLTAVVPENWMAVSNMPIASEKKVAGGREVEFQPTPSMSSYLNVFCAGEFDAIESEADGVKLRI